MANKIFEILNKPVSRPNKNGFDNSQFFPFSLKLGQVKPVYYVHTVPQGHYRISIDELTHTEPFITDPFVRLSKHLEVVFVPYSQLWHPFSQFIGQSANDQQSSYEQSHQFTPVFNLGNMLERIWNSVDPSTPAASRVDMQGLWIQETALSLLDMLGYGAHPLYNMSDESRTMYINSKKSKYCNAWNLLAYNKYWNTFLRDTQHTSPLNPAIFNADKVPCTDELTSIMDSYYTDAEMLQLVTIKYRKRKKDLFTSALTSRQFGAVEGVNVNFSLTSTVTGDGTQIGTFGGSDGYNVVVDRVQKSGGHYSADQTQGLLHGADTAAQSFGDRLYWDSVVQGESAALLGKFSGGSGVNSLNGAVGLSASGTGTGSFDVYTLLTAQMMQKWREQIQRAGNQTDDRIRAIYGSVPNFDAKNQPIIIGSTSYDITANQVTSTGEGTNVKLGDIAAKGIGYAQRNSFEFTASEFGVIMVLTYVLPENNYLAPIDKLNTLAEPFDYFTPQLENLGLEQIEGDFRGTLTYSPVTSKYVPKDFDSPGFAARYWAYKCKVPVVHLGFEHGASNSIWIPSRVDTVQASEILTTVSPYYVAPNEYDTVFGTQTDYHIDTDQFVGAANVKCDCVLPMSELGLPRW